MRLLPTFLAACLALSIAPAFAGDAKLDIARTLKESKKFAYLSDTLKHVKRLNSLHGPETYTLFVPENRVFDKMAYGKWTVLWNDPKKLDKMISHGIVKGSYDSAKLANGATMTNILGETVKLQPEGKDLWIGKVKLKQTDIYCTNGVIHLLDEFLDEPTAIKPAGKPAGKPVSSLPAPSKSESLIIASSDKSDKSDKADKELKDKIADKEKAATKVKDDKDKDDKASADDGHALDQSVDAGKTAN